MFKSLFFSLGLFSTPLFSSIAPVADINFSLPYLDDFIRPGYQEDTYKLNSEGEFSSTYTNNEQHLFIHHGLLATTTFKYTKPLQAHETNCYGGGESGINVIDTAFKPSQEIWDLTKHLINYDHLSFEEKMVDLSDEEQQANDEKKFFQFKIQVNFGLTINDQSYKFVGEFTPRYSYQTGILTSVAYQDFPNSAQVILNQLYQAQIHFEPFLSVHEQKRYTESDLQGPGVMPRFWISGCYNSQYFEDLQVNVPYNNEVYATLTTKIIAMSLFHLIKILDFTHAQQIEINLEFDPTKQQLPIDNLDLYFKIDNFIKSHFKANSPIQLWYENLRTQPLPVFNHANNHTTLCLPISFKEAMGSSNYQQILGQPLVKVNIFKKIDLKTIGWPEVITYQTPTQLETIINTLLVKNYLLPSDVISKVINNKLFLEGNNAQVSNKIEILLHKEETSSPPPLVEAPSLIPDDRNNHNDQLNPDSESTNYKNSGSKNLELLWLLLLGVFVCLLLLFIWWRIKKKKKR
ncbi:hypothetical protein LD125_00178 [Mesoplasma sp. JKS002658]|uniref:hypothetical protein n=1 Tax=Mesoplasma whartonense TaxID=2878854 RepID=UPI002022A71E|nr:MULTISPECIES: hypothetical protein [unclassified Mesoplasma]MCL8211511.1 hypothetical protein [Mesoplasma sp. JKS002664]MCL8211971.1 hypothetical protein [Mesoplasma sp. JKS002662]MCL8213924.1 hypothetical protein [Mesoplasma sp. JKS002658]MCL8214890.1 hypothetical protein [Mesoplasma sp. JKS002663]MCL8215243.1 hypothetical protein [Mesoplasma sp. JKS002659]